MGEYAAVAVGPLLLSQPAIFAKFNLVQALNKYIINFFKFTNIN
jgi:hypothetical protein